MRALLLGMVLLAGSVAQGIAATHEYMGYSATIAPHDLHHETLSCTAGKLLSGGYSIDNYLDEPLDAAVVILNSPISDDTWGVGFRNESDAPLTVKFRIALLCDA